MNPLEETLLHSAAKKGWQQVGVKAHHGINLLLPSLHSKQSSGIGEFFDLLPLIDWCHDLGMDVIQLLPLNQLETEPSPYNAFSSCALNFIYLSLHALPFLENETRLTSELKELRSLNNTPRVAIAHVAVRKTHWLHAYVELMGKKIQEEERFREFVEANSWVKHYALYRALLDHLGNLPEELSPPNIKIVDALIEKYQATVDFYLIMQHLSFLQLKAVKEYGRERGVFLMGDLPILLSSTSVDVWQYPQLFIAQLQAGAPPDVYNQQGQNWEFPILNWESLRKEHFHFWKQRLSYAEQFYDIFRIDHVLGFFRIWAIPPGHPSKEGFFIPTDQSQWMPQAEEILEVVCASTQMLPIAEDLGAVEEMVRPCLTRMGICGTKVLRWERKWHSEKKEFIPIDSYSPVSLSCVSTHDAEPLTLWWKLFPDEAKAFAEAKHWTYTPELTLAQKEAILWDSHHSSSLFHINLLYEYLSLFPDLVHPDPQEERINIPGTILPTNWTYKCIPSVEEITSHKELFEKIKTIIS